MFAILLGGREVGKSYSVTNFFVDQWKNKGIPFTWLRLTEKAGWFRPKLNKQEFDKMYDLTKKSGVKHNIARTVAMSQEYVDRKFEKKYKELYGKNMGDIRDKADREQLFTDFVDELVAEGKSYDDARNEFEKYFY